MIKDKPILGHGLKILNMHLINIVIRMFLLRRWDKAHNDYLELIGEFGVIIPLIFFGYGLGLSAISQC